MANESQGWIKLHRQLMDNPAYSSEPFCRMMAWVDLLLLANHSEGFFYCRGIKITVERGQIGWGIEQLAKRWKWSRGKVERYMKDLENERQIVRQKSNITTLISIVNYETYQGDGKANSKADGQQTVKQTDTNKNVKKEKKEKNDKNSLLPDSPADIKKTDLDSEPYWKKIISTWYEFYKKNFNGAPPSFKGPDPRHLKKIIGLIRSRAEGKGIEWTEDVALSRFSSFLEKAHADPWLKAHFLLSNLEKQFDAIATRKTNGSNQAAVVPIGVNSKSAGAIELLGKLKAQLTMNEFPAGI